MFTWWSLNVCGSDVEAVKKLSEEAGRFKGPENCQQEEPDSDGLPGDALDSEQPLFERAPGGSSDV